MIHKGHITRSNFPYFKIKQTETASMLQEEEFCIHRLKPLTAYNYNHNSLGNIQIVAT